MKRDALFGVCNSEIVGLVFNAVFVERDGMSEVANRVIAERKWERARHYPDRANRLPRSRNIVGAKGHISS